MANISHGESLYRSYAKVLMRTSKLEPVGTADHPSMPVQHPKYQVKHGATTPTVLKSFKKKVQSGVPGQVDFLAGQVTLKACLPNGQGSKQVILKQKSLTTVTRRGSG